MNKMFTSFDNIQDPDWGWGVFYPSDSNAADLRCRYVQDPNDVYECNSIDPQTGKRVQGTISAVDNTWSPNNWAKGSGEYPAGNPYADPSWGGGTGCHFASYGTPPFINQENGKAGTQW